MGTTFSRTWKGCEVRTVAVEGGYEYEGVVYKSLSADAARQLGVTRAGMTQLTNLLNLSARVQEALLLGDLRLSERRIRALAAGAEWDDSPWMR